MLTILICNHSIAKSFVNAKAKSRQYKCTASEAGKVHGGFGNGMNFPWRMPVGRDPHRQRPF